MQQSTRIGGRGRHAPEQRQPCPTPPAGDGPPQGRYDRDTSNAIVALAVHNYVVQRRKLSQTVTVRAVVCIRSFARVHLQLDPAPHLAELRITAVKNRCGVIALAPLQPEYRRAFMQRIEDTPGATVVLYDLQAWIGARDVSDLEAMPIVGHLDSLRGD